MKPLHIALGIVFALLVVVLTAAAWLGAFRSVAVERRSVGPFALVYAEQRGHYRQTGGTVDGVMAALREAGIQPGRGFGIFYDDPAKVKEAELRSEAGAVVDAADVRRLGGLRKRFKVRTFAKQDCLVAAFPMRHSLSMLLGVMKAYPKLASAAKEHGVTPTRSLELYDPGRSIEYVMPVR